jgi:hypothetical protein
MHVRLTKNALMSDKQAMNAATLSNSPDSRRVRKPAIFTMLTREVKQRRPAVYDKHSCVAGSRLLCYGIVI